MSEGRREEACAVVDQLMRSMRAAADRWVALDVDTVTVAEAGMLLEGLDRQINRLEGARSKLAASFARRDGHRLSGHKDLGHWMQDRLRRSPNQARKEAKTAERLAGLSATAKALDDGEISFDHAAAVAEQASKTDDPEAAQRTLLAEARTGDPGRVRKAGCARPAGGCNATRRDGPRRPARSDWPSSVAHCRSGRTRPRRRCGSRAVCRCSTGSRPGRRWTRWPLRPAPTTTAPTANGWPTPWANWSTVPRTGEDFRANVACRSRSWPWCRSMRSNAGPGSRPAPSPAARAVGSTCPTSSSPNCWRGPTCRG